MIYLIHFHIITTTTYYYYYYYYYFVENVFFLQFAFRYV